METKFWSVFRFEMNTDPLPHLLSHQRPQVIRPTDHGLQFLKLWAKINIFIFINWLASICYGNRKVTDNKCLLPF